MADTIKTPMSKAEIDRSLKAFLDAENPKNNGKILYIRHGEFTFNTYDYLFNVIHLKEE